MACTDANCGANTYPVGCLPGRCSGEHHDPIEDVCGVKEIARGGQVTYRIGTLTKALADSLGR